MNDRSVAWSGGFLLALGAASGIAGCDNEPATAAACGAGREVTVSGATYCVYEGEGIGSFRCPAGFDERLEVSGRIVCAQNAIDPGLCTALGVPCPPPPFCPVGRDFDGALPAAVAFDGKTTRRVAEPLVLQPLETYSRDGFLALRDGVLIWARTHDRCGFSGDRVWWGLATTRITLDADQQPTSTEDACVPDTFPGVDLRIVQGASGFGACWVGHANFFGVRCGMLEHAAFTRETYSPGFVYASIGAGPSGYLVYAADRDPPVGSLRALDDAGRPTGLSVPVEPLGTPTVVHIGAEWWVLSWQVVPRPAITVRPFADDLTPGAPFEVTLAHTTAQELALSVVRAPGADALHALVGSSAPGEDGRLTYLYVRPDRTFASRELSRRPGALSPVAMERSAAGLVGLVVTLDDTGEARIVHERFDCEGRLLEPTLLLDEGPLRQARALATDGPHTWAVTSEGNPEPGFTNRLHTLRTE